VFKDLKKENLRDLSQRNQMPLFRRTNALKSKNEYDCALIEDWQKGTDKINP
jgi:hypothetical protein